MTHQQRGSRAMAGRVAVKVTAIVATAMAVLAVAPSANAAPGQADRAASGTSVEGRTVKLLRPTTSKLPIGDALGVASAATVVGPTVTPYARRVPQSTWEDCEMNEVCIWSQDGYTGVGYFFGGNYAPCEGFRFQGTAIQNHTWSIWTRASGPISIWDQYADGTNRYNKYGLLYPNTSDPNKFSYIMDAWVYDPNNNCTSLNLHLPSGA
jgi:hypothetical protein